MPRWLFWLCVLVVILFGITAGFFWWRNSQRLLVSVKDDLGVKITSTSNLSYLLRKVGFNDLANSHMSINFSKTFPPRNELKIWQSLRGDARQELAFACNWQKGPNGSSSWQVNVFINPAEYKTYLQEPDRSKQLNYYTAYCLYRTVRESEMDAQKISEWTKLLGSIYMGSDQSNYFMEFK